MTALAVVGCLLGGLVLLVLATGLPLAMRYRRVEHQPTFPTYQTSPPARRHADLRAHPEDPETQEIPTAKGKAQCPRSSLTTARSPRCAT